MRRICRYCGQEFDGDPGSNACPRCVEERKHDVLRDRTCRACGKVFVGGPRAWFCPECRAERRRQHEREARQRKKAGMSRLIGSQDICEKCGKPYTVNGGLQRFCRVCAPVAIHKKALELTKAWNAANTTPEDRRELRKAHAAQIACVICGKLFVPDTGTMTCSPECSSALAAKTKAQYQRDHSAEINAKAKKRRQAQSEAMTPEEYDRHREQINAAARANYARRLDAMTPEELQAYREKRHSQAKASRDRAKPQRFCVVCGLPIPPDVNHRSFCSEACKIKKRVEHNRKQYEKRKEVNHDDV